MDSDIAFIFGIIVMGFASIVLLFLIIPDYNPTCQEEAYCDAKGFDGYSEKSDCCYDFTGKGTINSKDVREYKCKEYGVSK